VTLVLDCPGHFKLVAGTSTYVPGCGKVTAVRARRKVEGKDGKRVMAPVLVCPNCGARLLPTKLEIERSKGGK
jgi:predicted RNA-binding Zn-ribbon protein involved in translation (DUF1610 family)